MHTYIKQAVYLQKSVFLMKSNQKAKLLEDPSYQLLVLVVCQDLPTSIHVFRSDHLKSQLDRGDTGCKAG